MPTPPAMLCCPACGNVTLTLTGHQRSVLAWDLTLLPDGSVQLREHSGLWLYETDAFRCRGLRDGSRYRDQQVGYRLRLLECDEVARSLHLGEIGGRQQFLVGFPVRLPGPVFLPVDEVDGGP